MTHSMREIMQIVEGSLDTKMRPTPEDLERIRQMAISRTGTAASLENIPPSAIKVIR